MRIYIDTSNIKFNHLQGAPGAFRPPMILHRADDSRELVFGPIEMKNARLIFSEDRDARPQVRVVVDDWVVSYESMVPPKWLNPPPASRRL